MHNHSYENELNLHVNEISFSYEKMSTKTRFEEVGNGLLRREYDLPKGLDSLRNNTTFLKNMFQQKRLSSPV